MLPPFVVRKKTNNPTRERTRTPLTSLLYNGGCICFITPSVRRSQHQSELSASPASPRASACWHRAPIAGRWGAALVAPRSCTGAGTVPPLLTLSCRDGSRSHLPSRARQVTMVRARRVFRGNIVSSARSGHIAFLLSRGLNGNLLGRLDLWAEDNALNSPS